jgi:hypothetical protein
MKVPFYIFSYNRKNCLEKTFSTIKSYCPHTNIYIIDDGSDDLETLDYLNKLDKIDGCQVIARNNLKYSNHGGFQRNFNYAVNHCFESGNKYACFAQDDIQTVRTYYEEDLDSDIKFLIDNENCLAISLSFLPKSEKNIVETELQLQGKHYTPKQGHIGSYSFIDGGLIDVERLINKFGQLENDEYSNQKKASNLSLFYAITSFPVGCRLPFQKIQRRGRDKRAIELLNKVANFKFYPYHDMDKKTENIFLNRSLTILPYAEDWLNCEFKDNPDFRKLEYWGFAGEPFSIELQNNPQLTILAKQIFSIEKSDFNIDKKDKMIISICEKYLEINSDTPYKYS